MINLLGWWEMVTEILFIFDVILGFILSHYIWRSWRNYSQWWRQPHLQGAIALLLLTAGHGIVRAWSLAAFWNLHNGGSLFDLENRYPISLAGTVMAVIGMCWCIRIFGPDRWGERGWIGSMLIALGFVLLMSTVM